MTRTVLAAVDDMFFASKIRATAEHLGVNLSFARTADLVLSSSHETRPDLIVVDLQSEKIDPITLAKELKSDEQLRGIPLLGFFSHVLAESQRAAIEAGFDSVVPRSVFSRDLAKILAEERETGN